MAKKYQTIRIWKETAKKLKLIYALTDEQQIKILNRLVSAELKKINEMNNK